VAYNQGGESNSGVNPKFNLSYQADPQLLIYGTIAKGFRPGGGNQPVPVDPNSAVGSECLAALQALGKESAPAFYGPDSVWSYELGEKAHFGSRFNVNADVYYEDWRGIQQTVPLSCGFPYTDNTGNAAVMGGEVEGSLRLLEGLTLSANTGYADAYLTQNSLETGSYKGERLQDVPRWTASSSLVYSRPINDRWTATWRAEYSFMASRVDATYATNDLPAYSLVNLRMSVSDTKWTAALFVNNLLNTRAYLSDSTSLSLNLPTFNRVSTNQPLTAGMSLSYHY
jgi:outer membrane receptor protein involved in Fe transport